MSARLATGLLLLLLPGHWPTVSIAASPAEAPATRRSTVGADPGTQRAITALDACVRRLDPERDVGFGRITALCPRLRAALEASDVAAQLPSDWTGARNELSAGSLRALRRTLARPEAATVRRPPDARVLRELVRAAGGPDAGRDGAWARFGRWLRSLVEGRESGGASAGPLARLDELTLPQRVWTVLGYLAVLALLGFAAWIGRAELRAAGWLARPRPAAGGGTSAGARIDDALPATLEEVAALERPAWLLRRLAMQLHQLGRLPAPGHLTSREVARAAQLDRAADREPLHVIAAAAERVRFGPVPPAPCELVPAVDAAALLLRRLGAAPRAGDQGGGARRASGSLDERA